MKDQPNLERLHVHNLNDYFTQIRPIFTISAIAGILLKPQDFHFLFSRIFVILKNSDILFGSGYKREI